MSSLRSSCEQVLRGNDRGGYTVPSPRLYPHQWAWDSAFAAIGWSYVDPARAWRELETLMDAQWEDGRVPHVVFHVQSQEYFPGPSFWETERTSSISQPPIWATCARRVVEVAGWDDAARALVPKFDASHRWFGEQRDPLGWHAIAVVHPWESGLDNCPVWDAPLMRVDVSDPPEFRRRDTHVVGDVSMRPTDEQYLRYACLVKHIARDGFGPGPFAVYDPMITAILARAEDDLAWLAERAELPDVANAAAARGDDLRAGLVSHLWDAALGRFVYHDARANERLSPDVVGSYVPLWSGLDDAKAGAVKHGLAARFATRWRIPSTSPSDPAFDARRYWRGPIWTNVNWLLAPSVPDLSEHTIALVEQNGIFEYYEPDTGEGLGGEEFTWTAALVLDLLARR
jgi:glycogen debranching enzyme